MPRTPTHVGADANPRLDAFLAPLRKQYLREFERRARALYTGRDDACEVWIVTVPPLH